MKLLTHTSPPSFLLAPQQMVQLLQVCFKHHHRGGGGGGLQETRRVLLTGNSAPPAGHVQHLHPLISCHMKSMPTLALTKCVKWNQIHLVF